MHQQRILQTVEQTYLRAEACYSRKFERPSVIFGIRGRVAGKAFYYLNQIKLNSHLYLNNTEDFHVNTIPHECAHLISFQLYGRAGTGHGRLWKQVMRSVGAEPTRCHAYDNIMPGRVVAPQYDYACDCRVHKLTKIRHNRIVSGKRMYQCNKCGTKLKKV